MWLVRPGYEAGHCHMGHECEGQTEETALMPLRLLSGLFKEASRY